MASTFVEMILLPGKWCSTIEAIVFGELDGLDVERYGAWSLVEDITRMIPRFDRTTSSKESPQTIDGIKKPLLMIA